MATVTVISNSHNPLAPSWDEAIVPTLRKRMQLISSTLEFAPLSCAENEDVSCFSGLESESRILTQRLSTISTSTDDAKQPQPSSQTEYQSQSYEDTHDTRHSTSSSRRTPNGTRSHTPTNSANPSQRPSAIPRPSYSRAGERSNASAVRSNAFGPVDSASSNGSRPTTGRKRTQSTPFPFEPSEPTSSTSSGRQLSSSTNSGSGTAKANNGRTTPTPSRIPTVPSRIRSGSQSSQGIGTIGKSTGLKLLPSEPIPNYTSESLSTSFQAQSSSFNVSHQRPSEDHQVSRGNTQQPGGIEESINERISSDEERPFQHWYRGDVARNGGVGEYRVGKRVEMLDIASFGHKSLNKAHRTGTQEGSIFPPTFKERTLRKRAESVSSVERTSLYREASDEIMERVLDETPLTDAETSSIDRRPRRQSIASMERISLYMEPHDLPQVLGEGSSSGIEAVMSLDAQNRTTNKQLPLDLSIPNTTAGKSKPPHPRPRNMSNPRHESKASTSTNASLSETVSFRNGKHPRGRAQSPVERSRTPQKKTDQKRSKSAADPLRHPEPQPPSSTDYTGLANAVPDTRTPVPVDGNWDEVCFLLFFAKFLTLILSDGSSDCCSTYGYRVRKERAGGFKNSRTADCSCMWFFIVPLVFISC